MESNLYRWVICISGTLLMFTITGLASSAFSVYLPFLRDVYGFTNAQTSLLVTVRSFVSFLSMFAITMFYDRLNIRIGTAISGLFVAVAFAIYSTVNSFPMACAAACCAGIGYGLGGMVPITILINRWFSDQKALALSICSAGSGIASFVVPTVVTSLVQMFSLRTTMMMESVFVIALIAVVFLLVRNEPKGLPAAPKASVSKKAKANTGDSMRIVGNWWVLAIMFACVLIGGFAVPGNVHMSILYVTAGYDEMSAALIISVLGGVLLVGKIVYGFVTDRLKTFRSNYLFFALTIAGFLLCCFADNRSAWLPYVAVSALGLGLPLATVGISLWATDLSDSAALELNVKRFQQSYVFGTLIFSSLPGIMADATDSYVPAYAMFFVMAVIAMAVVQHVYVTSRAKKTTENLTDPLPTKRS